MYVPGLSQTVSSQGGVLTADFVSRASSLFQGWFTNDKATFQQYTIVPAEIKTKVRSVASILERVNVNIPV